MKYLILVLSTILIFSISCDTSTEPETKEFTNTLWHLESFEILKGITINPPVDQNYDMQFLDDGSLGGVNDCNTTYGTYVKENGNLLTVTRFGGTKRGCAEDSMDDQFRAAILNVNSYEIDKDKLYINYSTKSRLIFKAH